MVEQEEEKTSKMTLFEFTYQYLLEEIESEIEEETGLASLVEDLLMEKNQLEEMYQRVQNSPMSEEIKRKSQLMIFSRIVQSELELEDEGNKMSLKQIWDYYDKLDRLRFEAFKKEKIILILENEATILLFHIMRAVIVDHNFENTFFDGYHLILALKRLGCKIEGALQHYSMRIRYALWQCINKINEEKIDKALSVLEKIKKSFEPEYLFERIEKDFIITREKLIEYDLGKHYSRDNINLLGIDDSLILLICLFLENEENRPASKAKCQKIIKELSDYNSKTPEVQEKIKRLKENVELNIESVTMKEEIKELETIQSRNDCNPEIHILSGKAIIRAKEVNLVIKEYRSKNNELLIGCREYEGGLINYLSGKMKNFIICYGEYHGEEKGNYYYGLVMEKCKCSLMDDISIRSKAYNPYNENELLTLLIPVIESFRALHARKIYHLDIKPQNLLLTEDEQTIKIIDFNVSPDILKNEYIFSSFPSEILPIQGTNGYMAPELEKILDQKLTMEREEGKQIEIPKFKYVPWKVDSFSFGLTMLQMCTMKSVEGFNRIENYEALQERISEIKIPWMQNLLRRVLVFDVKKRVSFSEMLESQDIPIDPTSLEYSRNLDS